MDHLATAHGNTTTTSTLFTEFHTHRAKTDISAQHAAKHSAVLVACVFIATLTREKSHSNAPTLAVARHLVFAATCNGTKKGVTVSTSTLVDHR